MPAYEALFAPVSLTWRAVEAIQADLVSTTDPGGSRRAAAHVELLIRLGDADFRARRYQEALRKYKAARAEIYSLITPQFNVGAYQAALKDVVLPLDVNIERRLKRASLGLIDGIRPLHQEVTPPPIGAGVMQAPPVELEQFTNLGFQEARSADSVLQDAATNGAALLVENRPAAAVEVMRAALEVTGANAQVDRSLVAALELNLAAAHVQMAKPEAALEFAKRSVERFAQRKDQVGVVQALHMFGVASRMAGDEDTAAQKFSEAAQLLARIDRGELPGQRDPAGDTATGTRASGPSRPNAAATSASLGPMAPPASARTEIPLSRELAVLDRVVGRNARTLTYRVPGRVEGWGTLPVTTAVENEQRSKAWTVSVPAGSRNVSFPAGEGRVPVLEEVDERLYKTRIDAERFSDIMIRVVDTSTTTFYLTHLYAYLLPLKVGDAYHELGQFANAETNYMLATSYSSLNRHIEATVVWLRLARNILEWGSSLYKAETLAPARHQFERIVGADGAVPASVLYDTAALQGPSAEARSLLQQIHARPLPAINPEIAAIILEANGRLANLRAGFDFYGLLLSPIHTFEYLQQVARAFCQQAIQAEREFVNFKSRQELEAATRRDLENSLAMAQAEAAGRQQLLIAAQADLLAADRATALATLRRANARDQRDQYAAASATQVWAQAASQAQLGGSDSWFGQISELADKLDRGESISGERGKLAAAYTLQAGRKTREYELARMEDTINELGAAIGVAQAQRDAASARAAASEIAWQAALQQVSMAGEAITAFDNEFFTPDAWERMAAIMRNIGRSYLERAIRIAKLMERSYNFENDEQLTIIKTEYGFGIANEAPGRDTRLLGGDALQVDVDSFTYQAITSTTRKASRIKDVVSLASQYPAQFEAFLATGLLAFETDLYDFERLHPGFYEQRIEAVEVEVVGLLADQPLHGTLTAGGVTSFRRRDDTMGSRTHVVDTMALSDFQLRTDMFLYVADTGVRGLFQGLGLGGSWLLHLPRRSNAIDLRRIFDIRLVFYYKAKFDAGLRATVLARPARPGELRQQRTWSMRFDFPAVWFAFYRDGAVRFPLNEQRLPANQRNFRTHDVRVRIRTAEGVDPAGIELRIVSPSGADVVATSDADGIVSTDAPDLGALVGIDPLGEWRVQVTAGASLVNEAGDLDRSRVFNLQFSIDYDFEYLAEAL